jgi:membrane-bound acyltransferase YfiQ involved in biofilm formation
MGEIGIKQMMEQAIAIASASSFFLVALSLRDTTRSSKRGQKATSIHHSILSLCTQYHFSHRACVPWVDLTRVSSSIQRASENVYDTTRRPR